MENKPVLSKSFWASVSGGKDSLFMLLYILKHPNRYPLNGVVHYELEIDFTFIKNVIDYMEQECKKLNLPFLRIKPRKTWEEYYNTVSPVSGKIWGFPTRKSRWCNSQYKLDGKKQLVELQKELGKEVYFYIGICSDEVNRIKENQNNIYPLYENGIPESAILKWAKTQPIFNNYYITSKRCGCMYCPLASRMNMAYLYKYYPEHFSYMIEKIRETEKIRSEELGRPFAVVDSNPNYNADYLEKVIKSKWLAKLNEEEEKFLKVNTI